MKISVIVVAVVVVAVAALVLTRSEGADVAQARKETSAAIARAKIVESDNRILKQQSDSALARAAAAERRSLLAEGKLHVAKNEFTRLAVSAPDTCAPVIIQAEKALAEADRVIAEKQAALTAALKADSLDRQRADDAEAALRDLRDKSATLVAVTKPNFWKRLRPELQVGVLGGVDVHGKPNAVAGVGFGWRF